MNYIIKDWAGNTLFNGKTFPSIDDAWEEIYNLERQGTITEADFEEYFVDEVN